MDLTRIQSDVRHRDQHGLGSPVFGQVGDLFSGRVATKKTDHHCCWPGQTWSKDSMSCVGQGDCPPGREWSRDEADCVGFRCTGGRVEMAGRCCWPGQKWSRKAGQCRGTPQCPPGTEVSGVQCVPKGSLIRRSDTDGSGPAPSGFVLLEPGVFARGSPRQEPGRFRNETLHTVALTRPVWLKETEVTQSEWLEHIPKNPSLFVECGDHCPVERVNWYEALEYLNRLSVAEGLTPCYRFTECTGTLEVGVEVPRVISVRVRDLSALAFISVA